MNGLVVVGAAGAVGALGRHALDLGVRRLVPDGPSVGILVANVVGAFVLGVLTGASVDHVVDPDLRLAVGVGFCGGLSTFSTFMAQLAEEVGAGRSGVAARWCGLMVVAGLVAAGLGIALGTAL